ncbi:MAG: flagellar basal body-associated FliL family protein [Sphingorhabdus sp.]
MSKIPAKAAQPKKSKKMKIIMIVLGGVILLAAGIGGGIYAAGGVADKHSKEDENMPKLVLRNEEPEEVAEGAEGKAAPLKVGTVSVKNDRVKIDPKKYEVTYYPLEQAFTANLADGNGFVQVGLSLATYYDGKVISNIQRQMVPVRSAVLMVLSQQDATFLSSPEGKVALQKEMTRAVNAVLREKEGFGGIDNVYFSNLVIQ